MTNDKQKDRLVELIGSKVCEEYSPSCHEYEPHTCEKCYANFCKVGDLADAIIADGWMRPPCKVGQTVYFLHRFENYITEHKVANFYVGKKGMSIKISGVMHPVKPYGFGRNFFTAIEEAEEALKGGVQ